MTGDSLNGYPQQNKQRLVRGRHGAVDADDLTGDRAVRGRADEHHGAGVLVRRLVALLREARGVAGVVLLERDARLLGADGVEVLDAVGVDTAGAHRVDHDVVRTELARHRLAHADHTHAEGIGENEVIELLLNGGRGGVHDASAAALLHVRKRRTDGGGVAVQALLIAVRPVGLGQRLKGAGLPGRGND